LLTHCLGCLHLEALGFVRERLKARGTGVQELSLREKQLDVCPWRQCSDRLSDVVEVLPNETPVGGHQDNDRKTVSLKVLLVAKILIRRDECREALGFGRPQELPFSNACQPRSNAVTIS